MNTVTLIGIDLGKHCFHLHGQDAQGRMVFRKKLSRSQMLTQLANFPVCRVVMEACAGAHWIARRLSAMGHEAKLISPQFVKPFVQGNKNDFADAQAIIKRLPAVLAEHEAALPPRLIAVIERLRAHFKYLDEQIKAVESELAQQLAEDERSQRLLEIPGVGPITASVLAVELGDAHQFAASIGLVPRQYSTGGKPTLLGISKRGDKNLRRLLVQGARVIMQRIQTRADGLGEWVRDMLCRRHSNVVACALANKMARIAWAILAKGTHYQSRSAVVAA